MVDVTAHAPQLGVGLIGYAFMGKAHSHALKTMAYMLNPPPAMPLLAAIGFLANGAVITLVLSAPAVLTEATGFTAPQVGAIVSIGGLTGAGVMLLSGWAGNQLADRVRLTYLNTAPRAEKVPGAFSAGNVGRTLLHAWRVARAARRARADVVHLNLAAAPQTLNFR